MIYIKLLWIWLKIPFTLASNPYKPLFKVASQKKFGYHLNVKKQRQNNTMLNKKIRDREDFCLSDLISHSASDVAATDIEDYQDLQKSLTDLITTSMYTLAKIKKPE